MYSWLVAVVTALPVTRTVYTPAAGALIVTCSTLLTTSTPAVAGLPGLFLSKTQGKLVVLPLTTVRSRLLTSGVAALAVPAGSFHTNITFNRVAPVGTVIVISCVAPFPILLTAYRFCSKTRAASSTSILPYPNL